LGCHTVTIKTPAADPEPRRGQLEAGAPASQPQVAADFAVMFSEHYRRVVRALELSGLDRVSAEDSAQEAFARTLGHWSRVRTGTNPAGYVYRTAFRLARRELRRARPVPLDEASVAAPGDEAGATALRLDVEAALRAMPPRRRACAVGCLVLGLSTKEVARALGIAEGTVRKQLEHARSALRPGGEGDPGG
jgi:RNA polymerase sigma factor (sigma-70 family)